MIDKTPKPKFDFFAGTPFYDRPVAPWEGEPIAKKMTLAEWDSILEKEPLTPDLVRKFISEEGGLLDLTEEQLASFPRVLNALHQIRAAHKTWQDKQTRQ